MPTGSAPARRVPPQALLPNEAAVRRDAVPPPPRGPQAVTRQPGDPGRPRRQPDDAHRPHQQEQPPWGARRPHLDPLQFESEATPRGILNLPLDHHPSAIARHQLGDRAVQGGGQPPGRADLGPTPRLPRPARPDRLGARPSPGPAPAPAAAPALVAARGCLAQAYPDPSSRRTTQPSAGPAWCPGAPQPVPETSLGKPLVEPEHGWHAKRGEHPKEPGQEWLLHAGWGREGSSAGHHRSGHARPAGRPRRPRPGSGASGARLSRRWPGAGTGGVPPAIRRSRGMPQRLVAVARIRECSSGPMARPPSVVAMTRHGNMRWILFRARKVTNLPGKTGVPAHAYMAGELLELAGRRGARR